MTPPTSPETADIETIAGRLSDAQKNAIINCEWRGSGATQFALVDCIEAKITGPLAHMFTLRWDRLTELGLAVRRHLLSGDPQ